jgi:hypothetical protein
MDDPIADGQRGGQKPVAICRCAGVLSNGEHQFGDHRTFNIDQILLGMGVPRR